MAAIKWLRVNWVNWHGEGKGFTGRNGRGHSEVLSQNIVVPFDVSLSFPPRKWTIFQDSQLLSFNCLLSPCVMPACCRHIERRSVLTFSLCVTYVALTQGVSYSQKLQSEPRVWMDRTRLWLLSLNFLVSDFLIGVWQVFDSNHCYSFRDYVIRRCGVIIEPEGETRKRRQCCLAEKVTWQE